LSCYVCLMHKEDLRQVAEIDREAFPAPWPQTDYEHELRNPLAHYIVACDKRKTVEEPQAKPFSKKDFFRLGSMMRRLFLGERSFSSHLPSLVKDYVTGFAGFWIMADEAHITNIAVRQLYRHQGIGELLLIATIDMALELNARILTLEVRASNMAAQGLYCKYGFIQVGRRRGYYTDDGEDAIIMSVESIAAASFQARLSELRQVHASKWGYPFTKLSPSYQLAGTRPAQPDTG